MTGDPTVGIDGKGLVAVYGENGLEARLDYRERISREANT